MRAGEASGSLQPGLRADAAIKILLGDYCAQIKAAMKRLRQQTDREALHDFRVALRRMRSVIRAYRPYIRVERALDSDLNFLHSLSRASNKARDAEVGLVRLKEILGEGAASRAAKIALQRRLTGAKKQNYAAFYAVLEHRRLERILNTLPERIAVKSTAKKRTFRQLCSVLVREHQAELRRALDAVRSGSGRERLHQARIAAKRLRYVLEPAAQWSITAGRLVQRLRNLQDLLGLVNDVFMLEDELLHAARGAAKASAAAARSELLVIFDRRPAEAAATARPVPIPLASLRSAARSLVRVRTRAFSRLPCGRSFRPLRLD